MNNAMAIALHQQIMKERACRTISERFVTQPTECTAIGGRTFRIPTHEYKQPRRSTSAAGVGQWLSDPQLRNNVYHTAEPGTTNRPGWDGFSGYEVTSKQEAGEWRLTTEDTRYVPMYSAPELGSAYAAPAYAPAKPATNRRAEWARRCREREATLASAPPRVWPC